MQNLLPKRSRLSCNFLRFKGTCEKSCSNAWLTKRIKTPFRFGNSYTSCHYSAIFASIQQNLDLELLTLKKQGKFCQKGKILARKYPFPFACFAMRTILALLDHPVVFRPIFPRQSPRLHFPQKKVFLWCEIKL